MRIGRAAVVTDTGKRRLGNEDAYVFEPPLFAIADGMGGARAGEIAADLAASALEEASAQTRDATQLSAIIAEANRRVWERSRADPATAGMGTTVTIALVDAPAGTISFGHVGDSRAYRLRDGALEQVTTDHSLVAELVESGVLTPEEAERHPQRSAITKAVGTEPSVDADVFTRDTLPGDLFLLCSDGLSDMLSEEEIASAIEGADRDPEAAGDALVAAANARGGEDNITVVLFEIVDGDAAEPHPEQDRGIGATTVPPATGEPTDKDERAEASEPAAAATPGAAEPEPIRHGAGAGGRIAALALVVSVLAIGLLVLYLAVR
ncbi:MAG: Stp1/IreP family PP2C-type Ser/Thr phosphatase [Actinobacteria bacterium]|nr:Stp1/IreP family PP2C-type Ser/Thr phosphatase [Actinomycetota bacterium]